MYAWASGAGGLAGWTKRSCLWLSGPNTTCAQRLPVNSLNTYRNDLFQVQGVTCSGCVRVCVGGRGRGGRGGMRTGMRCWVRNFLCPLRVQP